jgi:glycerol kinase
MMAMQVPDTNGCYVVPAFTGLGAPHWDQYARGTIVGLTRGVNKYHIIRATLESIAYQTDDILRAMRIESGVALSRLRVDGGASRNDLLMQFQADISASEIERPASAEATARGAAYLAGLVSGFWQDRSALPKEIGAKVYKPQMDEERRAKLLSGWRKAVRCAEVWGEDL